ncbi:hypothetical protein [Olleya sp. YS]|uniref:DUF922 domain-containing protein n=1 Tax=Olleya sp. YS TaxID=3028318 RepID=UPI0024344F3D|nr:hypothetical protein [Olleya sp. YS]WGD34049.1 hypothetical protein Ollyesu_09675 [Olleya sp. YS]
MLKYIVIFAGCMLLQSDAMEELSWSEHYKLTWNDFKGQPNPDTDAVAVTASGITFSYSIKQSNKKVVGFKTLVKAFFYPEHSWCKAEQVDAHVLGHEQLHFDITELHARLFRQRIAKIKPHDDLAQTLQELHKTIEDDLANMQHTYDAESNFSIDVVGQQKWKDSIAIRLKATEKFKSKG